MDAQGIKKIHFNVNYISSAGKYETGEQAAFTRAAVIEEFRKKGRSVTSVWVNGFPKVVLDTYKDRECVVYLTEKEQTYTQKKIIIISLLIFVVGFGCLAVGLEKNKDGSGSGTGGAFFVQR